MDDRLERLADWQTLDQVRRFALAAHAIPDWHLNGLPRLFIHQARVEEIELPPEWWGFVICRERGEHDERWDIRINDRLPIAAGNATLAHEYGHLFQQPANYADGVAACLPFAGLPIIEQEAHACGAILTVPFDVIASVPLSDCRTMGRLAEDLFVPYSYVEIRNSLAFFLTEKAGRESESSAHLNAAMIRHRDWQIRIADWMSSTGRT